MRTKTKKPVARKIKATWKPDPKVSLKGGQPKPVTYRVNLSYVVMLPPPTAVGQCPRCGKPHKKIKPLKFAIKPMEFFSKLTKGKNKGKEVLSARASHWFLCPKLKEPVIFFDHYVTPESIENYVAKKAADDIANQIDKEVLADLKAFAEPKQQVITVRYKGGNEAKKDHWVFEPNAPERIVPGTKKQAREQRARVRAQERAVKEKRK